MCKVISIANQKGGQSKSTTSVNLAIGLARQGKRVAIIDADPQGSCTASLGYKEPDVIYYEDQGKAQKLPGRMCIGDGYGGLIQSMQKQIQRQLQDEGWMRLHQERGSEMYQSYVAEMTNLQEHILPHLQAYCSLEERQPEETANSQEVVTKTDTGKMVERKSPAKADERRQPDQPQTKQGKKKLSIHERLQRNKEMIAAQKGSERKERSVEVI